MSSHDLCLRTSLFLPCRSVFRGQIRKRWCHDGYRLQCFSHIQMYRPPPLLRYDLSARVHMEHLLDDLVGKNQVWSDAILNTGEKCVVLLEITGSNQLGLCVSLCNIVCWCMTTLIFLVTILSLGIYFCFRKCGNSFGRSKVQGKSNKCVLSY